MAINKGKTEGGSGGKRGHSNMNHWTYTEEIKRHSTRLRRLEDKRASQQGAEEHASVNDENEQR